MKLASGALATALLAFALAGCGEKSEKGTTADPAALERSAWVLSGGIEVAGWQQVAPSITFQGSDVGGSNGCNSFGGTYKASGSSLRINQLGSTLIGCSPPAAEVEEEFMAGLEGVSEWRIEGGELALEGGGRELRFRAASPEGSWRATSILRLRKDAVTSPIAGTEITATIADGAISGSSGCNEYSGHVRTEGLSIRIGPLGGTEMACSTPAGVMEQEQDYLEALPCAAKFKVEAGNLILLTAKGTIVATFEPRGGNG